ncbi:hypothetical protein Mal64_19340 [Pseudobythopirellula maris]|uniref:Uncharacterized protein n=1 Tax=Pseudobythopirellula maris TaxID=2527991 RepID=A0A5C5ZQ39_9BACT|nr:hypothetical protein [Pseudobythopirellula maris]TWT88453.1 hypothetical protein Mal64_19340 [Pseudobythopirellula maris]
MDASNPTPSERAADYSPASAPVAGPRNQTQSYWSLVWLYLSFAGGLYPLVVVGVATFLFVSGGLILGEMSWSDLADGFIPLVIYSAVLFFAVFVFVFIIAGIVILLTRGVLWWLRWSPPRDRLAAFVGALVAHLATLWVAVAVNQRDGDLLIKLIGFLIGPAGATLFGQFFGSMAATWQLRRRRVNGSQFAEPWRFPLWRLMATVVPLCMLLSFLSWVGWLTPEFFVITLAWLVWQQLSWRPVAWLANRYLDTKLRRRRRGRVRPVLFP